MQLRHGGESLTDQQTLATSKADNRFYETSNATDRDFGKIATNEYFYLRVRLEKKV